MPYHVFPSLQEAASDLQDEYAGFVDEYNPGVEPLNRTWSFADAGIAQADAIESDGQFIYVGAVAESVLIALDRGTGEEIDRLDGVAARSISADGSQIIVADGNNVRSFPVPDARLGWNGVPTATLEQWRFNHGAQVNAVKLTGPHVFLGGVRSGGTSVRRLDASNGVLDWDSAVHDNTVNTLDTDGTILAVGGVRDAGNDALISLLIYADGTAMDAVAGAPNIYANAGEAECFSLVLAPEHLCAIVDTELYFFGVDFDVTTLPSWTRTFNGSNQLTHNGRGQVYVVTDSQLAGGGSPGGIVFEFAETKTAATATANLPPLAGNTTNGNPNQLVADCDGFGLFTGGVANAAGEIAHRWDINPPVELVRKSPGSQYRYPYHKDVVQQNVSRTNFSRER